MTDRPLRLGELLTIPNTLREHRFEAGQIVVGHVMIDDDVKPVAFTQHELERPVERAAANKEDLPAMAVRPPSWDEVEQLKEDLAAEKEKNEKLMARGLWARIRNRGVS